jgi:hypothetical protein
MDMGHARAGADAAPLIHTTCSGVHPKIIERAAQVFIVLTIFGVVEVASTMVIFSFMRRHPRVHVTGVVDKFLHVASPTEL